MERRREYMSFHAVLLTRSTAAISSYFFFSSRRRHTRCGRDWSSDVCSSDLSQKLENEDVSHYISGEVATAGMFRCLNCNHMLCLTKTSHLHPCEACGSHYFERVTSRWPPKEG